MSTAPPAGATVWSARCVRRSEPAGWRPAPGCRPAVRSPPRSASPATPSRPPTTSSPPRATCRPGPGPGHSSSVRMPWIAAARPPHRPRSVHGHPAGPLRPAAGQAGRHHVPGRRLAAGHSAGAERGAGIGVRLRRAARHHGAAYADRRISRPRPRRLRPSRSVVITSGYVQALSTPDVALGRPAIAMEDPGLPTIATSSARPAAPCFRCRWTSRGARIDGHSGTGTGCGADRRPPVPDRRHAAPGPAARRGRMGPRRPRPDRRRGRLRRRVPVRPAAGRARCRAPRRTTSSTSEPRPRPSPRRSGWPGWWCRIGWSSPLDEAKRYADRQTDTIGQLTLADLIAVARLRPARARQPAALPAAPGHAGRAARRRLRLDGIAAGLHALIRLPDGGPSEQQVLAKAADSGARSRRPDQPLARADEAAVPRRHTGNRA